jgi:hypothetical protein
MFVGIDSPERPFVEKAKMPGAEDGRRTVAPAAFAHPSLASSALGLSLSTGSSLNAIRPGLDY